MFEKGEVEEGNKLILNNEELKNAQKVLHVIGYQLGKGWRRRNTGYV